MTRTVGFRNVVVPTDFSTGARRAIERAARILGGTSGRLHVLHVLPQRPVTPVALEEHAQRGLKRVRALVERTARAAGFRAPTVVTTLLRGEPFVEIIRYSRAIDADLIVLGRTGAGRRPRKGPGTTVSRVVRMGDTPALVVGARSRGAYRRPLVALSLDPSMRRCVNLVRRVSETGLKTLRAVHSYHVPFEGFVPAGTDSSPSLHHRQVREQAAAALGRLVESLQMPGIRFSAVLRRGNAASVILGEASSMHADLIALGTHGRSGLSHVLLGSVAELVIACSPCDVLIARPVRFTFEAP